MKTADLIPFILLELNECDKYGFELTKAIETKSGGKILIKQPTLYTLLKKLEKSKFIASYWQDSDIGGKRHYYKLTENGKLQVSTLPSYDFLLQTALEDNSSIDLEQNNDTQIKNPSIMDELVNSPKPIETILPSEEVFAEKSVDTATELELNTNNTELLENQNLTIDEEFAANKNVARFTEKVNTTPPIIPTDNHVENNLVFESSFTVPKNDIDVKFVDYVDFKQSENYKNSKKSVKKLITRVFATSIALLVMLILSSVITHFTGRSVLYYLFFIAGILITLFYPTIYLVNMDKLRITYQTKTFETKTKLRLYIGLSLSLTVLIVSIIVSLYLGNNSFGSLFGAKNFANLYAPLLISSIYFVDVLFNHLLLSKTKK